MHTARRWLGSLHRWVGLLAGVYFLLITLTGAALLFRIEMQRALDPQLFTPQSQGPPADPVREIRALQQAYPQGEVSGIEAPTNRRPTTLAYVQQGRRFITVLLDPASGRILGELPQRPLIRALRALHFELWLGRTGRVINGIGALLLALMGVTATVLWWRGRQHWREGFKVRRGQPTLTTHYELHSAAGIWATAALLMWGITGAAFIFDHAALRVIGWFSAVEAAEPPQVMPPDGARTPLPLEQQLAAAARLRPDRHVARILLPGNSNVPLQVMFARHSPTVVGEKLESLYVDPWRGTALPEVVPQTAGQSVWDSFGEWHTAAFGGYGVRCLWLGLALLPALLLVTGLTTWWLRRIRKSGSSALPW